MTHRKNFQEELTYIRDLVYYRGLVETGNEPASIANYIRLQAASAFHQKLYVLSASLGYAATCINEDARNKHEPRWNDASNTLLEAAKFEDWKREGR